MPILMPYLRVQGEGLSDTRENTDPENTSPGRGGWARSKLAESTPRNEALALRQWLQVCLYASESDLVLALAFHALAVTEDHACPKSASLCAPPSASRLTSQPCMGLCMLPCGAWLACTSSKAPTPPPSCLGTMS